MQVKHSLCHWRSSKEMYLAPARPARIKRRDPCVYMTRRLIRPHLVYLTLPTRAFGEDLKHEWENRMRSKAAAGDSLVMGLVQPTHFFAYRLLKHSRQYG